MLQQIQSKLKERWLKSFIEKDPDDFASRKALVRHLLKGESPVKPDGRYIPYTFDGMEWVLTESQPAYPLPAPLPPLLNATAKAQSDETMPEAMRIWQQKQLGQRLPTGMKMDGAWMFDEWSECLAQYLDRPRATIRSDLFYLYDGYRTRDTEYCLRVINSFSLFPGFPFMSARSFADHIHFVCRYLSQATLRKPQVPAIPFIAFSKTASAYISLALAHMLQLPQTVLSFQHQTPIRPWVKSFARFGGITHEHYQPTPYNLSMLEEAGIRRFVIHRRHPICTVISHAFHSVNDEAQAKKASLSYAEQVQQVRAWLDREMHGLMQRYASWWRGWQRQAAEGRIEMLATRYEDMVDNPVAFFQRVLSFYGAPVQSESAIRQMLGEAGNGPHNFRRADSEEWKEVLTPSQAETLKRFTATEFKDYE